MAVSDPVQRYEVLSKVVKNHCVRQSSSMASGVRLPTSFGRLQLNGCCALSSGHPMQVVSGCEELSAMFTIPSLSTVSLAFKYSTQTHRTSEPRDTGTATGSPASHLRSSNSTFYALIEPLRRVRKLCYSQESTTAFVWYRVSLNISLSSERRTRVV